MKNDFEINKVDDATAKKLLGIKGWFLKGEKREDAIISKLVAQEIKKRKKNGEIVSEEEIDKIKFAFDPVFKQKIIAKVHADCDREYNKRVRYAEQDLRNTENYRTKEIKRIEESRWEDIFSKKLRFNSTEGVILINNTKVPFSSIKGASVKINESYRLETKEKGKSRKHASVGGALVGSLAFGPVGGIVGGSALGKTTHTSTINTNNIPTATYVGVVVDIDGFMNEVAVLEKTVDQDSKAFHKAIQNVQEIISKLQYLSTQPVPESFLQPEEEVSVLAIDQQIVDAKNFLEMTKADTPKYEIPERYL